MSEVLLDILLFFGPLAFGLAGLIAMMEWPDGKSIPSGSEYLLDDNLGEK